MILHNQKQNGTPVPADLLMNAVPAGICQRIYNERLSIVTVNHGLLSLSGFTEEEIASKFAGSFAAMIYPDDRNRVFEEIKSQLAGNHAFSLKYRIVCKNDQQKWVLDCGKLMDGENGEQLLCSVLVDVNEDKKRADELKLSLERHKIIMDQTEEIIFEWEFKANKVIISPNYEKKFGCAPEMGRLSQTEEFLTHIHPDDEEVLKELVISAKGGQHYCTAEMRIRDVNNRYIWCRVRVSNQYDENDKPVKIIGVITDIDDEKRLIDKLRHRAERDALTGLYNREETVSQIENYLLTCLDDEQSALMMVDIDNFKEVNDSKGHLFGDALLTEISSAMKQQTRSNDIVGRIGGDEFTVFLKDVPSQSLARKKAEGILKTIRRLSERFELRISCSIGVALCQGGDNNFEKLYQSADAALYRAKIKGKNQVAVYENGYDEVLKSGEYSSSLGAAIDSNRGFINVSNDLVTYVLEILYATDDIEKAVSMILEIVGKRFDVSRAYIFENAEDGKTVSNTFEWCNAGVKPAIDDLQGMRYEELDHYEKNFGLDGIFYCRNVRELPQSQIEVLGAQGIHSLLQCSIREGGSYKGFVGFDECTGMRYWNKEEIAALSLISKLLTTFLLKKRAQDRDKETGRRMMEILNQQDAYLYVVDKQEHSLLYLNQKTMELDPNAKIGMRCYEAFFGEKAPCSHCPILHMENDGRGSQEYYNPQYDVWTLAHASKIHWGSVEAYLISCQDITPYKT